MDTRWSNLLGWLHSWSLDILMKNTIHDALKKAGWHLDRGSHAVVYKTTCYYKCREWSSNLGEGRDPFVESHKQELIVILKTVQDLADYRKKIGVIVDEKRELPPTKFAKCVNLAFLRFVLSSYIGIQILV